MRSFRAVDPDVRALELYVATGATPSGRRVTYKYTGRERGVAFQQQSAGKSPAGAVKQQLVWRKGERLGITFVEQRGGRGVAVTKTAKRALAAVTGLELARVEGTPVGELDIASVLRVLHGAPSPCLLEFAPPPPPVTIAQVSAEMERSGVQPGMILASIDGESVRGAALKDVCARIGKADGSHPVRLELVAGEISRSIGKHAAADLDAAQQQAQALRKASVRNGMSVAAVLAALTF